MEYAIIELQGKQYKVKPGTSFAVDKMTVEGDTVELDRVLFYKKEDVITVGTPYIPDFSVTVKVLSNTRGKKIRVLRFRAKSKYHKVTGHRQALTNVRTDTFNAKKVTKNPEAKVKAAAL